MRSLLITVLLFPSAWHIGAQHTARYISAAESDPAAVDLLEKMHSYLERDRVAVDFSLVVRVPDEEPLIYEGQIIQEGNKYKMDTHEYIVWCDGKMRWTYSRADNEVLIYSAEQDGEAFSATRMFSNYFRELFIAGVTGTERVSGIGEARVIDMKPVLRDSEYAKLKFLVQDNGRPVSLEMLEKTGVRTTFTIHGISTPDRKPAQFYTFVKADFPGVHVEDLRID